MEYFGFSSSELSTPIGIQIKNATDQLLIGPDWQRNIEICDMISLAPGKEGPDNAIRAIMRRLQEPDQKIISLTLTVTETCMQNCGTHFSSMVNKPFMNEIIKLSQGTRGEENKEHSLRLIQQWGREYERSKSQLPIFFDTYISLKAVGAKFPPENLSKSVPEDKY